jgi:hypothetical protein
MLLAHHRGRRAAAALLALAAVAAGPACEPSPRFPDPAQPLVGEVMVERTLTMGSEAIELKTNVATLHVDPGTVPVGTKLVWRIVDGIVKDLPGSSAGQQWSFYYGQPTSVQLIADVATFARPVVLTVSTSFDTRNGDVDVLHADESAAAWTRVGKATRAPTLSGSWFTAELTEPHLWTLAVAPPPPFNPPVGLFRLERLMCGTDVVAATPNETLELDGFRYVWTFDPGSSCAVVDRGESRISIDAALTSLGFFPDGAAGSYFFAIQQWQNGRLDIEGPNFGTPPRARECAAGVSTVLSFVQTNGPVDAGASPDTSDGGCAPDAGGSGDATGG